jgi:hypothetical protein
VATEELEAMLTGLRLAEIREWLDALLEEEARRQINIRDALAWLCTAEIPSRRGFHRNQSLSEMQTGIKPPSRVQQG